MKTLLFMRHAHSRVVQHGQTDAERSLTTRGRQEAPMMGRALQQRGVRPERILTSPAVRALTTARIVAEELGIPEHAISIQPGLYDASTENYLELLGGLPDAVQGVLLVGHNPSITEFVNLLAPTGIGEMPPAGIVALGAELAHWSQINAGCGSLLFVERPGRDGP